MKTLVIIIVSVIFGMHSSNAQTINKLQIDSFLIDHTIEFNKKQFYLVIFGAVVELKSQQNKIALNAATWL